MLLHTAECQYVCHIFSPWRPLQNPNGIQQNERLTKLLGNYFGKLEYTNVAKIFNFLHEEFSITTLNDNFISYLLNASSLILLKSGIDE